MQELLEYITLHYRTFNGEMYSLKGSWQLYWNSLLRATRRLTPYPESVPLWFLHVVLPSQTSHGNTPSRCLISQYPVAASASAQASWMSVLNQLMPPTGVSNLQLSSDQTSWRQPRAISAYICLVPHKFIHSSPYPFIPQPLPLSPRPASFTFIHSFLDPYSNPFIPFLNHYNYLNIKLFKLFSDLS